MITLLIKGGYFDALKAAEKRGVEIILTQQTQNETIATASDRFEPQLLSWFCEVAGPAPFAAGSLLFYSRQEG